MNALNGQPVSVIPPRMVIFSLTLALALLAAGCRVLDPAATAIGDPIMPSTEAQPTLTATSSARPAQADRVNIYSLQGQPPASTPTDAAWATKPGKDLNAGALPSVLEWLNYAVYSNQPDVITDMIGNHGAIFVPYAVGVNLPGYNNRAEVFPEIEKALRVAKPVCLGYDPLFGRAPDKAIVIFEGLDFDWPAAGLPGTGGDVTAFEFFRYQHDWELVLIMPLSSEMDMAMIRSKLLPCPDVPAD